VKIEAILMFRKMDKTWSVVIQCLRDKKKVNGDREGRPGEAVVIILDIILERQY
jgi:hypothetical protein